MSRTDRNQGKAQYYRQIIDFCCDPDCESGYGLEVHHIRPLSTGGDDTYSNYIVLCAACHRKKGVHLEFSTHQIELLTYKFYQERVLIGVTSDEGTELEFHNALVDYAAEKRGEPPRAHSVLSP